MVRLMVTNYAQIKFLFIVGLRILFFLLICPYIVLTVKRVLFLLFKKPTIIIFQGIDLRQEVLNQLKNNFDSEKK